MRSSKPKIIAIVGPTASGKSALAIAIARSLAKQGTAAEIISADSRQVYKGLNLLSGKVTRKEMAGIPHHLLSVAAIKKVFSVADYKRLADEAIENISRKNKVAILCGGTGFYLQAVIDNISLPEVKANPKLRKELEKKDAGELASILKKLDPKRAGSIDLKNKVRLIRAIEIAKSLDSVPPIKSEPKYDVLQIGIQIPPEKLKENIKKRIVSRMKAGMLAETKKLRARGVSFKRLHNLGLECRYTALLLQKKLTRAEMVSALETEIWHYTKRQMTWFKKDTRIKWYTNNQKQKIYKTIQNFLR